MKGNAVMSRGVRVPPVAYCFFYWLGRAVDRDATPRLLPLLICLVESANHAAETVLYCNVTVLTGLPISTLLHVLTNT